MTDLSVAGHTSATERRHNPRITVREGWAVDRIVILVFSIAFACALLVGATYAAAWLAPYLTQMPAYWSMAMLAAIGMIAGAAAVWRRHRSGGLKASR
jgi:hypothetical protein